MCYFRVSSCIFNSPIAQWASFPRSSAETAFSNPKPILFLSNPLILFDTFLQAFCNSWCPLCFPFCTAGLYWFLSSAHHVSCCFSQAMLAGGEVGEGYKPGAMSMPWSWPCSALLVNLQRGRGGRISLFLILVLCFARCISSVDNSLCLCSLNMSFSGVVTQVCYEIT